MSAAPHFWLMIGNAPQGPFDLPTVQRKLFAGEIDPATPACPLGSNAWCPVSAFLPSAPKQAVQPRPKEELSAPTPQTFSTLQPQVRPPIPVARAKSRSLAVTGVCACVVGVGVVGGFLLWPSGYNLANRKLTVGTVIRTEFSVKMTGGTATGQKGDQVVQGAVEMDGNRVVEEEVLQVAGSEPVKIRFAFLNDMAKMTFKLPNRPSSTDTIPGALHGRTVLSEKVAGVWKRSLVGGNPNPAQARELQSGWGSEDIYPDRRLRLGETWTVNGPALRRYFGGSDFLTFQGNAAFTLQQIVTRNGQKCALIHVQLEGKGTTLDENNQEALLEMVLSGHTYRSLSSLTDETELSGQVKLEGTVAHKGQMGKFSLGGPVTLRSVEQRK